MFLRAKIPENPHNLRQYPDIPYNFLVKIKKSVQSVHFGHPEGIRIYKIDYPRGESIELSRSDSPESGTRTIEPILGEHSSPVTTEGLITEDASECGWGLIVSGVSTDPEILADEEVLEVRDEVAKGSEIGRVSE